MQVDALAFQAAPEPFDKDIVEEPAFGIHRDAHAGAAQTICPGKGREVAPLVGVHDLWRPEAVDRLVQSLDTEVGFQRVRNAPGQNLASMPGGVLFSHSRYFLTIFLIRGGGPAIPVLPPEKETVLGFPLPANSTNSGCFPSIISSN